MEASGAFAVCSVRFFRGFVVSEVVVPAIELHGGSIDPSVFSVDHSFGKRTLFARAVIVHILLVCRWAKIAYSVIIGLAVRVVDFVDGVGARRHFPKDSASVVQIARHANGNVSILAAAAGGLSSAPCVVFAGRREIAEVVLWPGEPNKDAFFRQALEALAQVLKVWQYLLSHVDLLFRSLVRLASTFAASVRAAVYQVRLA